MLGDDMGISRVRFRKQQNSRRAGQIEESNTFTLAGTIRSARMIVVAPLATAAYQIPMLISAGNYSVAIKCALVSSASFLILAISTTLADSFNRLLQR
jgi:hypothetical protein